LGKSRGRQHLHRHTCSQTECGCSTSHQEGPSPKAQATTNTSPTKQTPRSKRDRRIIVRREAFREPVAETRLKEIRDAVNAAIQQANKSPNVPKISGVTINEKKSYILSTLGNTPASEILKYRANVEAALRKIDKSVLRIEGDKKWYRLIVHGISTTNYDDSMEAITQLRTEIESYNPSVNLLNNLR